LPIIPIPWIINRKTKCITWKPILHEFEGKKKKNHWRKQKKLWEKPPYLRLITSNGTVSTIEEETNNVSLT
jgi:hypothetical protein